VTVVRIPLAPLLPRATDLLMGQELQRVVAVVFVPFVLGT
jgi:hypothetical protein